MEAFTLKITKYFSIVLLFISLFLPLSSQESSPQQVVPPTLKSITYEKTEAGLVFHIEVEGDFESEFYELESPHQLICQLKPIGTILVPDEIEVKEEVIEKIQVVKDSLPSLRLVFILAEKPLSLEVKTTASGLDVICTPPQPSPKAISREIATTKQLSSLQEITINKEGRQTILNLRINGPFQTTKIELTKGNQFTCQLEPLNAAIIPPLPEYKNMGISQLNLEPSSENSIKLSLFFPKKIDSFKIEKTPPNLLLSFLPLISPPVTPSRPQVKTTKKPPRPEKVIFPPFGNTLISLNYGSYAISSEVFGQVYGQRVSKWGGSLAKTIIRQDNHNFLLKLGFSRTSTSGEATITKEPTKFSMSPFSLSAQYMANYIYVIPYVGIGGDIVSYQENSDIHSTSGSTWGYHLEGGIFIKVPRLKFLMLNLYLKITKAIAQEETIEVDLGGLEFGLGLTFGFDLWKSWTL